MGANQTTIDFISRFDPSGATQAVQGNKDVGSSLDSLASKASVSNKNFDGLFKRLERPLGVIAFSGIANDLTNMGAKGENATQMIEHGLRAVGMALMWFNPLLGMAVIGGTALWEVLEKAAHAHDFDAKAATTNAEALQKQADAAKKAAENLKGIVSPQMIDQLKTLGQQSKEQYNQTIKNIQKTSEEATATIALYEAIEKKLKAGQALSDQESNLVKRSNDYVRALKDAKETVKALADIGENYDKSNKKSLLTDQQKIEIFAKQKEMVDQLNISNMKLNELEVDKKKNMAAVKELETKLVTETSPKKLLALEKEIELRKKLLEMDKTQITSLKMQEKEWVNWSAVADSAMNDLTSGLESGAKTGNEIMQKMASDTLKTVGESLVKRLSAQAIADMSNPMTFAVGVAELAAAGAVAALTGAAAGAVGGGSSSSSTSAGGGTSTSSNTPAPININLQLKGGSLRDPATIAVVAKGLQNFVQQNNGQVIATNVVGG